MEKYAMTSIENSEITSRTHYKTNKKMDKKRYILYHIPH